MRKTKIAALALAIGLAGMAAVAVPASADARPFFMFERHMDHPHFFFTPFFFGPRIFFHQDFDNCHWLFVRAEETGSRFWWNRFEQCREGF